jgi:DNA-binding NtrC family response regulator
LKDIKGDVVLIEDNDSNRTAISKALEKVGFTVKSFDSGNQALKYLEINTGPTVVVSDIKLPDISGMDILKKIKKLNPNLAIILITGYGSIEDAVEAMKAGADDYLTKPIDFYKLRKQVEDVSRRLYLAEEVENLRKRLDKRYGMENIIGNSSAMEKVYEQISLVSPTNSTVLLTGESGTGKELVANAIHHLSPRKHNRFLPLNCAAISPTILESELFGHEKGSFTGANQRRQGKFELADHGTLFLDEISEINADVQVKLLRVLEGKDFMRVGGSELINVDCRIIAATNRDLKELVDDRRFREDLYYRLKVVSIHLPPLRERKEDIPLLIDYYLNKLAEEQGINPPKISGEVMNILTSNPWKGNVRELKNLLQSMLILSKNDIIKTEHLPEEYNIGFQYVGEKVDSYEGMTMTEIEKEAIFNALAKTDGNRTKAAKILDIGLRTLQRKLKEYEAEGK